MRTQQEIRQACDEANIDRVRLIGASAWFECARQVLTQEEKAQVIAVWDKMSGQSFWMSAFFEWLKQQPGEEIKATCPIN